MANLSNLEPQVVWHIFEQMCAHPRPSKHEEKVSAWIQKLAKDHNIECKEDKVGNLILRKSATAGMEDRKGVVLQAHMDMVPQKNSDIEHNFVTDPIDAYVDGEWVTARGTTLGADNGIGLAASLAVIFSDNIEHGPLEVLVTIDEEAGMTGAFGLEAGWLEGDILLNTDSEDEGEVYMGCAGGIDANIQFPLQHEAAPSDHQTFEIVIKGLKGGHSGVDIHLGRGNANKLLARFLKEAGRDIAVRLATINGGTLRNAIPREAFAIVTVAPAQREEFKACLEFFTQAIKKELSATEPFIEVTLTPIVEQPQVLTVDCQTRLIAALNGVFNGVVRMSDEVEGVVETSSNLGVVETQTDNVFIKCLIRSLSDSCRIDAQEMIASVFELAGGKVVLDGAYPGWKPDTTSPIMQIMRDVYEKEFGSVPKIMVIHAGLECGLFKTSYPNMDMASFGPTICFPHSPDEKVNITTVDMFWKYLQAILKAIPTK
ncbi:aminoacyl-histidine dipeptidase [Moritella yayanosii]|uniref:Cytosol non-specific dipeptidase n=1 Tax=Moritella yayanosii TaxID=69539 RepID=A0A330LR16_9GAMM|nr:aminoacyl-histidine dipeptidase [Moritella yayanosii]SQD78882.1 aminoacyl-histidine dipeptidase (peptidase D) [Moritella yayanosii]